MNNKEAAVSQNDSSVKFLYDTRFGRGILKLILCTHADRVAVAYLRSRLSRGMIRGYVRRHDIPLSEEEVQSFRTYRDFFVRTREDLTVDPTPGHLVSPADSLLSVFPIEEDSTFAIKGSHYRLCDFLEDAELAETFRGGDCLIFRLCASDYHHYAYPNSGTHGPARDIPGVLHSVQPIACERFPVYTLNRRSWVCLHTDHFGPIVQTEIGALVVGGIVNLRAEGRFEKGEEKGRFELAGSTIVLLVQKGRVTLRPEIAAATCNGAEVRVRWGDWIGSAE